MLFHYLAADKIGKLIDGEFDADDVQGVLQHLVSLELRPVSVKPLKEVEGFRRPLSGGIKIADKIFLTKYLALMLRVGTDLLSAINILIVDFENRAMKNFLLEVRDNLVKGRPFHEAFGKYPKIFSPVFVNLVKSAEASGTLQQTFEDLSVSITQEADLRGRVRAAVIYPVILLFTAGVIFGFIAVFALPKIANVFSQSSVEPPLFSKVVFAVGLFVSDYIVVIVAAVLILLAFFIYFFRFNRAGKKLVERLLDHLPIIKKIRRDLAIQRFAATLSSLMRAGLPIIDAINITADTVGSNELKGGLNRISEEGLARGLTIGEAFRRESVFPRMVVNLVAISERAGHLQDVLLTLSGFYAANISSSIKSAMAFLEPILLVLMGLFVSTIALSIIVPVYQLSTQF